MKTRREFLQTAAMATIGAGTFLVGWDESYGQSKPILVGAPVPRASAYGQNGERGMILAAEEINAAGE